ncbi:MAG: DUF2199 domain-containing protein [Myxococcales bacterium]|nr:MAG: DUF2199 domain-containing protein [Myxococcales bacterium]
MSLERVRCLHCDEEHDVSQMEPAFGEPDQLTRLSPHERAAQVTELGDFRIWRQDGEEHFFVRCVLEVPRTDNGSDFAFGVWSSLSASSFEAAARLYSSDKAGGPFFGWLTNRIPGYPDTCGLALRVHVRADRRPSLELDPTSSHPLAVQQREGITPEAIADILTHALHPGVPLIEA